MLKLADALSADARPLPHAPDGPRLRSPAFWRTVSEGVIVSAMYQQSTGRGDVALWPDFVSLISGEKGGPLFTPRQILRNVYLSIGRDEEPRTVAVQGVHVSAAGRLDDIRLDRGRLSFAATFPAGQAGPVLVAGVRFPIARPP